MGLVWLRVLDPHTLPITSILGRVLDGNARVDARLGGGIVQADIARDRVARATDGLDAVAPVADAAVVADDVEAVVAVANVANPILLVVQKLIACDVNGGHAGTDEQPVPLVVARDIVLKPCALGGCPVMKTVAAAVLYQAIANDVVEAVLVADAIGDGSPRYGRLRSSDGG